MLNALIPRSFRNQILCLLLSSLVIAQIVSFFLVIGERSFISANQRIDSSIYQFSTFANLVESTPDYLQYDLLSSVNDEQSFFRLNEQAQLVIPTQANSNRITLEAQQRFIQYLEQSDYSIGSPFIIVTNNHNEAFSHVENSYETFLTGLNNQSKESGYQQFFRFSPAFDRLDIEAQLPSGLWLYATFNIGKLSIGLQARLISIVALTIIIVGISGFLITIKMTNPISSLAAASEKLGKGQSVPRLKEQGPQDIREALSAFNNMNDRLTQLISSQKQMLGAISHDLRSPLTSLRLRLESVEDSADKEKMINTVEEMNEMISSILDFTRVDAEEKSIETSRPVDLYNFCDSLIAEYIDTGRACSLDYHGAEDQVFNCRYISLRRALRNIIDNGLRYGEQVALRVNQIDAKTIVLIFSDKGPGLAEDDLTKVLQPFYRPDKARRIMDGGIGMGLSISQSIIKAHGGSICLANDDASHSVNKGLRVSVTLPL
ncbi:MAG: hypothetical protein HOL40_05055 [Cellvibrionales bacterium]|nr:hypothetical protein [Cellvibrionales bacterium]